MLATFKRVFVFFATGALLGQLLSILVAPSLLSWWNSPYANSVAMCDCTKLSRQVADNVIQIQVTSALLLALAVVAAGETFFQLVWKKRAQRRAADQAAQAVQAAVPPAAPDAG